MPEMSARLSLPFLMPAQAQKHVTHNEALELLDALVQLSVEDFGAQTPPPAPEDGTVWALGAAPVGAWAGHAGELAVWSNGGWLFIAPQGGWRAARGTELRVWNGSDWLPPDLPVLDNLPGIGVNAGHDPVNRLTVAAQATLFTHETGDHRLKINKNAAADTASLLYQTGWSGRAETGLAGSDDFAIKVSPDGDTWHEGLSIARASGTVAIPNGATVAGHEVLHRGNLLGTVAESAGQPTGAIVERGSNASGDYLRLADGTQICTVSLNMGNPTAYGEGTFANPYRTDFTTWFFPAAFAVPPVIGGRAWLFSTSGNDRRMVASTRTPTTVSVDAVQAFRVSGSSGSADCMVELIAIGRWF